MPIALLQLTHIVALIFLTDQVDKRIIAALLVSQNNRSVRQYFIIQAVAGLEIQHFTQLFGDRDRVALTDNDGTLLQRKPPFLIGIAGLRYTSGRAAIAGEITYRSSPAARYLGRELDFLPIPEFGVSHHFP